MGLKLLIAVSLLARCSLIIAADTGANVSCASFAADGTLAEVIDNQSILQVVLSKSSQPVSKMNEPLGFDASNCEVFFSADSRWWAVGAEDMIGTNSKVSLTIWNTRTGKLHSHFDVTPTPALQGYISLEGFYTDFDQLVITGSAADGADAPRVSMLVSLEG